MSKAVLIDNKRIQQVHALLAKLGLVNDKDYKREMVQQYSGGRETSTTGLFVDEAGALISDLQAVVDNKLTPDQAKADRKRKLIIHWAHEMLWYTAGSKKVDMKRLDDWCVKSGYLHKPLMEHTCGELSKLVWQFEQVHQDFLQAV
jgi:hypothetical protein